MFWKPKAVQQRFIGEPRFDEIPVCQKRIKKKKIIRYFEKSTSVFKDWTEDTPARLKQSLDIDATMYKCTRFIRDENEYDRVYCLLLDNLKDIKDLFIYCIANSSYPSISWMDYTEYC